MARASMGLASSPAFLQHRMERLFAPYLWKFVLVHIDDIIVFSPSEEQHLVDLEITLRLLRQSGVTLSLKKCASMESSTSKCEAKWRRHQISRCNMDCRRRHFLCRHVYSRRLLPSAVGT